MIKNFTNYEPVELDMTRANALADLLIACRANEVKIDKLLFVQDGYEITFEGVDGDAICHEHSYGRSAGLWESYKMPWDYDDVSVHDAETLAKLVKAVQDGKDWKHIEEESKR